MTVYTDSNNNEYEVISNVLHIRKGSAGDGVMINFSSSSSTVKQLVGGQAYTSVVIESGMTSIGDYAFYGDTAITDVTMADTVTSIGSYTFRGCTYLTSVTIGNGVTTIGSYAFRECKNLALTSLPSGITSISDSVFYGCTNLALTSLPSGITSIGTYAFYNCTNFALTSLPSGITSISNYAFYGCKSLALTSLPSGLTSIGTNAFQGCTNLALTSLPSGIISIGNSAFYGCKNLALTSLPSGITSIGNYAFQNCTNLALTELPSGVTRINISAFQSCTSLALTSLPNSVTSIGDNAFNGCSNLALTSLPNSVTSIDDSAFFGCTSLTSVTIPDSIKSLSSSTFRGCTSLTSVTIPDSIKSLGLAVFYQCTSLTSVTIPDSVTSIDNYAFYGCTSMTEVTMENPVPCTIGSSVFPTTTTIYVPYGSGNTYKSSWSAYANQIVELEPTIITYYDSNNNEYYIDSGVLHIEKGISGTGVMPNFSSTSKVKELVEGQAYTEVVIESGMTSIGNNAFYNDHTITDVTIADTVTTIGSYAFQSCTTLTSVSIGSSVTSISTYAFDGCQKLTSVNIPNSVITIGGSAFQHCKFTSVTIPDSVTSIGDYAFNWCSSLTSVTIGNGVTSIGNGVFNGCAFTSVTIPDSVITIGNSVFTNCTSLTSVTMQSTTPATIGTSVFPTTTTIYVPISAYDIYISSWSAYANQIYNPYVSVIIDDTNVTVNPDTVRTLKNTNFTFTVTPDTYFSLSSVTVKVGATTVTPTIVGNQYTISGTLVTDTITIIAIAERNLYDITDNIENGTVEYTSGITVTSKAQSGIDLTATITPNTGYVLPNTITVKIGGNVLTSGYTYDSTTGDITISGSSILGAVNISAVCGIGVYKDSNNNEYRVENGVLHIRKGSAGSGTMPNFTSTSNVKQVVQGENYTSVVIENGMKTIGEYAFSNDTYITNVDMADTVTSIGGFAIYGCTAITTVTIPDRVTSIGEHAFRKCTNMTSVTIGNSVATIGVSAFRECSSLTSITIPSSVTSFSSYVFYSCTSLTSATMENPVPRTINTSTFPTTTTIYVPYGSGPAYKSSWSAYANQIVELPGQIKKMKLVTAIKSSNLFDKSTVQAETGYMTGNNRSINRNTTYSADSPRARMFSFKCKPNTAYTIVKDTVTTMRFGSALTDNADLLIDTAVQVDNVKEYTYTTEPGAEYLRIQGYIDANESIPYNWSTFINDNLMIVEGSTAPTEYVPYGDRTIPMRLVTAIVPNAITENKTGHSTQTGTPTPDAPIPIVSDTYYDSDGNPVELRSVGTYADTYDATTHTITRNVGAKTITGTESWMTFQNCYYTAISGMRTMTLADRASLCNYFVFDANGTGFPSVNGSYMFNANPSNGNATFKNTATATVDAFKSYLASKYASGDPVIVLYPLATPTTETKVLYDAPTKTIHLKLITES